MAARDAGRVKGERKVWSVISKPEIVKYSVTWDVPRVYLPAKSAPARLGPFVDTRPLRAPMPWTRLAALASGLAKRLASCFASAKSLWRTLMAQLGTRSRQAARTTAPAESVQRVAQLSEPLLVAAAEEPLVSDTAGGRCWWTRKQRKAAQKLRVQRSVMLRAGSECSPEPIWKPSRKSCSRVFWCHLY